MKPTLIIGASENPERYAYKALQMLLEHDYEVFAYGIKDGNVDGVKFFTEFKHLPIDTVTMYVGPKNQDQSLLDYILSLKPKRVIFNPGTENQDWYPILEENGIFCEEACTLVLLSTDSY
jgi:predicted CoA-binding protein